MTVRPLFNILIHNETDQIKLFFHYIYVLLTSSLTKKQQFFYCIKLWWHIMPILICGISYLQNWTLPKCISTSQLQHLVRFIHLLLFANTRYYEY